MATPDFPDGLSQERSIDLAGRSHQPWIRRVLLVLLAVLPVLALIGVFGQHPSTSSATGPVATVQLNGPTRLRGGVIFQMRIDVDAHRAIGHPRIVLSNDWWDSVTFNTITPSPTEELNRDDGVALAFDAVPAGQRLSTWLELQVNPNDVGQRHLNVDVQDGDTPLVHLSRTVTVFP